jgi:hypothetical protein
VNEYPNICLEEIDKSRVNWLNYCDWGKFTPLLYVATTGGLCNRLFGIATCVPKARAENRLIKVYWPLNGEDGTSAKWNDLFEDPLDMFSEWDLYWIMDIMHDVQWVHNVSEAYRKIDTSNIVLIKSGADGFSNRKFEHFDMTESTKWLKGLKVKQTLLDAAFSHGVDRNTLGIHLRVREERFSDGLFKDNPVTPSLIKKIADWPGKVLVVSNSYEAKQQIISMFGEKIVYQDVSHSRSSAAVQSALVDLVMLAKCGQRVGNIDSTFYQLAEIWSTRDF